MNMSNGKRGMVKAKERSISKISFILLFNSENKEGSESNKKRKTEEPTETAE